MTAAVYYSSLLSANGGSTGLLTVSDTSDLVVAAHVVVSGVGLEPLELKVGAINGPTTFTVTDLSNGVVDVSTFTTAKRARVTQYAQRDVNAFIPATYVQRTGDTMTGALTVNGLVWSTSGGVKFPDGTTQSTAVSSSSVYADSPLTGNGTIGSHLGIQTASSSLAGALTAADWTTFNAKQSALAFSSPILNTGGTISIQTASGSQAGALSSSDWTTFNTKQSALSFSSPILNTGGTISIQTASGSQAGALSSADWTTFNAKQSALSFSTPILNTGGTISIQTASGSQPGALSAADWTTFNAKQSALSFSTPILNTSGTISIQTASSSLTGALTAADWTTFNAKQSALTFSSPILNTGGTISIQTASGSQAGALSAADWTTFNAKQSALTFSTPLLNTAGTISIQTASGSQAGALSAADWTTFNAKQAALTFTSPLSNTTNVVSMTEAGSGASGYVSTGAQTFAGAKTFSAAAVFSSGSSTAGNVVVSTDDVWLGRSSGSNIFWNDSTSAGVLNVKGTLTVNIDSNNNDSDTQALYFCKDKATAGSTGILMSILESGKVGIGASDPGSQLTVVDAAGTDVNRGIIVDQHGTNISGAVVNFRKSRGTRASKTTTASGDYIGSNAFLAYVSSNSYVNTAGFFARVNGTVTSTSAPTDLLFYASGGADSPDPVAAGHVRMTITSTTVRASMDGSASAPALTFGTTEDTNTGIYHPAADSLAISTSGAERLRIDSAGNVILNDGAADADVRIEGLTTPNLFYIDAGNNSVLVNGSAPDALALTPAKLEVNGVISTHTTSASAMELYTHSSTSFRAPVISFFHGMGTQGTPTTMTGGQIGYINFGGHDGTTYRDGQASVQADVVGAWSSTNRGTQVQFFTTKTGTIAVAQRMLIGDGALVINDPGNDYDFRVEGDTDQNLFFLDASVDAIAIGSGTVHTGAKFQIGSTVSECQFLGTVSTTDATQTTLSTITTVTDSVYLVEARVTGRRTGGVAGAAGDCATYMLRARVKNVAGTVTISDLTAAFTSEDQAAWDATIDVSGTDFRVRVTGAASNNVSWGSIVTATKL